jgi:hypothetical protein
MSAKKNGYVCDECPEDDRPVFPSREALWRAEVFEPFLAWVNRELANAVAVRSPARPTRRPGRILFCAQVDGWKYL